MSGQINNCPEVRKMVRTHWAGKRVLVHSTEGKGEARRSGLIYSVLVMTQGRDKGGEKEDGMMGFICGGGTHRHGLPEELC